ncbi:MAG: ribonuclease R [Chlamydiae bacterium]|nr:ribonuclease R [Chlamydiota bacterium]MBI3277534.1 ribonuclease R [Chlamydiota bacterium]
MINPSSILDILKGNPDFSLTLKEIKSALKVRSNEVPILRRTLKQMTHRGQLNQPKKGFFSLPTEANALQGILRMNPKGFGFVELIEKENEEDLFIHRENLSSAIHGDLVSVQIISEERREGRVKEIIQRAHEEMVGTLEKEKNFFFVVPDNPKLIYDVIIPPEALHQAKAEDKVIVQITRWPSQNLGPQGKIIEVLGRASDPKLDSLSIARTQGFALKFPPEVEKESDEWSDSIPKNEYSSRWDLRHLQTLTIDPIDARDFDDAISIEKLHSGWRLGIHIADVSFYAPPNSLIDKEAFERGCTVYFKDRAIRMLPEKLSRHICSLEEGKDRLTKTVFVELDPHGKITDWKLGKSIINSKKRFSYGEVTEALKENPPPTFPSEWLPLLKELEKATNILFHQRMNQGALELDIPEIDILQDHDGHPTAIHLILKEPSHRLVEECMLLANHLIARFLIEKKLPGLYRVHPAPSQADQESFVKLTHSFGMIRKFQFETKSLQNLVKEFHGKPASTLINIALLRSLRVAHYSEKNLGHFALALEAYSHFTSPIRRYPDLCVHQVLDAHFSHRNFPKEKDFSKMAYQSSLMEKKADEAEREFIEIKRLRFLNDRLEKGHAKPSSALISNIKEYGLVVEDEETLARGFIHVSSMKDDYYIFDPERLVLQGRRSNKRFKIGDRVRVKVSHVDLKKKQVDFKLA